jgi:hypothetical protein
MCDCGEHVEADRYDQCYDCWWSDDPRNPKNAERERLLKAFAKALNVEDARGWSTGKLILKELGYK